MDVVFMQPSQSQNPATERTLPLTFWLSGVRARFNPK
jgi:hypothetical protein